MISVEEALSRILSAMPLMPTEVVSLLDAHGRVLAEDVPARLTQPPFDISAMDGYAVRQADVTSAPTVLDQIGEVPAGNAFKGRVEAGETVRIFTGGRMPDGADCVVIQENTDVDGRNITINKNAEPRQNVRDAGTDFSKGEVVLKAGSRLGPRYIGLLAAMNVPSVSVAQKPKVAILSTGDELARPGDPIGENQIVSSNSFGLSAQIKAWGGEPIDLGIAPDDEEELLRRAQAAKRADMLITSGGASVGDHDLIQKVLSKDGLEVNFWKIAMKPGKPLIFGSFDGRPMIGLPGNPVSALVCAQLYLKPALAAMQGNTDAKNANTHHSVPCGSDLRPNGPRQDHIRARLSRSDDGEAVATPFSQQDSSQLKNLANADCLIVRKPNAGPVAKGERVSIIPLFLD